MLDLLRFFLHICDRNICCKYVIEKSILATEPDATMIQRNKLTCSMAGSADTDGTGGKNAISSHYRIISFAVYLAT